MKPAISQVSSLHAPFESDIEEYAAGDCHAIDVWLTKLEDCLRRRSLNEIRELVDQHAVELAVASYQGGILASQGEARRSAWELFERRLRLCRDLGIATLVIACDVGAPLTSLDLERVRVSLREAARAADAHGIKLALEFQASSAFGNNLQSAAAMIEEADSPALGLCLDLFHFHVGPSKTEDLECLTRENLFHVQVCDLAGIPREFAADADRVLPGDGDIPREPLVRRLREIGYQGCVAVELLNPQIWQIPPRQFCPAALAALNRFLG
ncbi:MAG: sugar phosphate isomerase/epimerase [Planctomycetes bacterium]|nr:sugar phosphate isomerase/epimerase [Planctomycetota bacterium]